MAAAVRKLSHRYHRVALALGTSFFMPAKALAEADVGLLVDVDVPWIPSEMPDNPATWWAHIDVDAEKRNFPIWTFPGNLRMAGDSHRILSDLLAVLKARADDGFKKRAAERVKKLAEEGMPRVSA